MGVSRLQGSVKVYPLPDDGSPMPDRIFSHIPSSAPVECVARVYIVKVGGVYSESVHCEGGWGWSL